MHPVIAFDISTTRSALTALRAALAARIDLPRIELGHYGDGGLHLILPLPSDDVPDGLRQLVYDTVVGEFGGSFSAEHGIGPKNADAYARYVPAATRALAAALKERFDPLGILGWRTEVTAV
jgi:FAD/FMN-containing dehydrogenase